MSIQPRWTATTREGLTSEYREAGAWSDEPINERFAKACNETSPDSEIVVISQERPSAMTFREIRRAALTLASGLKRIGVGPGSRVAMQLPNWIEACFCFHACCAIGATPVPILHLFRADEVLRIVARSKASTFVVAQSWLGIDYQSTVETVLREANDVENVLVVGGDPGGMDARVRPFEDLFKSGQMAEAACADDPDAYGLIAFTSGVTGEPKGIVHTSNTMIASTDAMVAAFGGAVGAEVAMNPNPVGHNTGVFVTFLLPFLHDLQGLVLLDRWDPDEMLSLIERYRVTVIGGAPVFLNGLMRSGQFAQRDTSSLRAFLLGGDTVPPQLVEAADSVGWTAVRAYGLTEQPSVSMGRPDDPLVSRAQSDGYVVDQTDIRLVGEDGEEVDQGYAGEVWVRGPGQCVGLLDGDSVVPASDDNGWLHTGDVAELDDSKRLTIRGRLKDVIIRGGEKISCSEVEEAIGQHPDVLDVCVAGMPDSFSGQRVVAFVVPRSSAQPTLPEIARHCVEVGLAGHKVPKRLQLVNEIPRSIIGKMQRYRLVESIT